MAGRRKGVSYLVSSKIDQMAVGRKITIKNRFLFQKLKRKLDKVNWDRRFVAMSVPYKSDVGIMFKHVIERVK